MAARSRFLSVIALVLVACLMIPPLGAAPLRVKSDRSDNTFYLTYESGSGDITDASSSARFVRGDPVTFFVYVTEAPDEAGQGERLKARLRFELNKRRVVRYVGRFRLEVRDTFGEIAYRERVQRKIVLRPRTGQRMEGFSIFFDLPTGSYETKAFFRASR